MQKNMNSFVRVSVYFALFVFLGLTFGFLTFKIMSFSKTVEVPSLINMTMIEADKTLGKQGLDLRIEGEDFDASVPPGRIVRQDVPPGNKVKERRAIKVVISKGPRVSSIPLLVNQTLQDAEFSLMQKGLRISKVITVHSDSAEKGVVLAQKPGPEDKLSDTITLLVSAGPHSQTYYFPDFQGKLLEDVRDMVQKMGFVVETHGTGSVVRLQRPKPGTLVKNGDKIYFELKEVTMP